MMKFVLFVTHVDLAPAITEGSHSLQWQHTAVGAFLPVTVELLLARAGIIRRQVASEKCVD